MGLCIFLGERNNYNYYFLNTQFPWDFASSWGRGIIIIIILKIYLSQYIYTTKRGIQVSFPNYGLFEGQSERWHIKGPMFLFGAK
jgi:hypothetical protein